MLVKLSGPRSGHSGAITLKRLTTVVWVAAVKPADNIISPLSANAELNHRGGGREMRFVNLLGKGSDPEDVL